MEDCINRGTIVASGSPSGNIGTGGISAFYTPGSKFVGCANYGTVQAEKKPYCGGIVGHFKKIVVMDPVRTLFDGCHNSGAVKAVVGQGSGVLAYCHKNVTIRGCSNSGTVTGKSTMGGLVSTMASGSEIIDCWNSGDVVTDAETAGGIVANNANACVIKGCVNSGDIASKGTTATSGKTVGGIAGTTGSMVSDCINFGTISGFKDVGGLVGAPVKGRTGLVNCYNAGDVIAPEESGGALCGTLASGSWDDTNNVSGCYFVDCFKGAVSEIGQSVSMSELVAMDMGDGWCRISDDCMPLPEVYSDNPMAIVNCAAVVPADGEAFDGIGADMALGLPDGVSWSSSLPAVVISGSRAEVVKAGSEQDVVLTATDGVYSRRWPVRVKAMSGIDSVAGDGVAVVSARYYDLGGAEIVRPVAGRIYIVEITYRDGTVASSKIMYCE
ncbi:MAG: hypothetical protein K2L49_02725, partial [Muribaculaceae bacterium]|nr:hypothetical protein [Muribaculaceae bacterium]